MATLMGSVSSIVAAAARNRPSGLGSPSLHAAPLVITRAPFASVRGGIQVIGPRAGQGLGFGGLLGETPAEHLAEPPPPTAYIRRRDGSGGPEPWDARSPVPSGYVLMSVAEVQRERAQLARGAFTPPPGKPTVVREPVSPPRAGQPRRRRTPRTRAMEAARRQALGLPPIPPRVSRAPRPPRAPRRSRPSRPPRRARAARPPRPPRRPGTKGHVPGGFCKVDNGTGGCWNVGTCGPAPSGASTGPPETVGHCVFESTPDCAACQLGSCRRHGRGLIAAMLAKLPASWRADPAHRERAEAVAATRRRARRQRRLRLPEELPPALQPPPPVFAPLAPAQPGCQRHPGPGFGCGVLVPWPCSQDPLVSRGFCGGDDVGG